MPAEARAGKAEDAAGTVPQAGTLSAYTKLSVALFTLLWLFVLLNLVIAAIGAGVDRWTARTNPVSRKYGSDLVEHYPGMTAAEVNDLLRVTWSLPARYEPFYGRRVGPVRSRFVNVGEEGFRLGRDQAPWPPDGERRSVVFFFGGSTAFGFGVPDGETIPSHLQELLAGAVPRPPALFNFGVPAGNSTTERIQFQQLLAAGHRPQIAVFLDGLNDVAASHEPLGAPELAQIHDRGSFHRPGPLLVQLLRQLPATRLLSAVLHRAGLRGPAEEVPAGLDAALTERVVERYRANLRMAEAVAERFGVTPLFVWQPVPEVAYPAELHAFETLDSPPHEQRRQVYEGVARLHEAGALGESFVWCAHVGRNATAPLYVDVVHYSGAMSRAIARCIADAVRNRLGDGARRSVGTASSTPAGQARALRPPSPAGAESDGRQRPMR